MNEKLKRSSMMSQIVTFLIVMIPLLGTAALFGSHISFQKRIVGVMQTNAAQELGLFPKEELSAFSPRRVWFATREDGRYEFRSAWPLVGSVPFDMFGSGTTDQDLLSACDRVGKQSCRRI